MAGGKKQPSTTTTTQKVEPWDAAKPYYETLYGAAQQAFNATDRTPYTGPLYAGPTPQQQQALQMFQGVANGPLIQQGVQTAQQLAGQAASGQLLDNTQFVNALGPGIRNPITAKEMPHITSANIAPLMTGGPQHNPNATRLENDVLNGLYLSHESNPYLRGAVEAATGQVQQQLMRQVLPALQDQSIAQGAYGGSGYGVAQGLATSDFTKQALDIANQVYYQNYATERGHQQGTMGQSLDRTQQQYLQQQQLEAQRAMQQAALEQQAALANQGVDVNSIMQAQQLNTQRQLAMGQLMAGNYNQERQYQMQAPQLFGAATQMSLLPAQLMDLAGSQQQAWNQADIDAQVQRYNMNQMAPWSGLGEWAQILNGGGFSSTGLTQPRNPGASFLQGAAGVAGIANSLFPQALPAAGNWLANLFKGGA